MYLSWIDLINVFVVLRTMNIGPCEEVLDVLFDLGLLFGILLAVDIPQLKYLRVVCSFTHVDLGDDRAAHAPTFAE